MVPLQQHTTRHVCVFSCRYEEVVAVRQKHVKNMQSLLLSGASWDEQTADMIAQLVDNYDKFAINGNRKHT